MRATALPGGAVKYRAHGLHQARVGVGDHQLHPAQPAGDEAAQEAEPSGAVLGADQLQAEDLALALGVDPDGDQTGHAAHALLVVAAAHHQGIQPDVGVGAGEQSGPEGLHRLVQAAGDLRDLVLPRCPRCRAP